MEFLSPNGCIDYVVGRPRIRNECIIKINTGYYMAEVCL